MICTTFCFQEFVRFSIHTIFLICCLLPYASLHRTLVFGIWARKLCDIYSSIGCALSSFRPPLDPLLISC
nr:hypothetical protein (insertion sequence IS200) - Salmonella typhimurium [Salmonella enterica subsp. enterica serovar Typhimurium]